MIRINRLTDYGFVVLSRFADRQRSAIANARDLSEETGLPLPTVSKLLKQLSKQGLLQAHRGAHGGYTLTREPESISAVDVIEALDGPIAITDCVADPDHSDCDIVGSCRVRPHWERITETVRTALSAITLANLSSPIMDLPSLPSLMEKDACGSGNCSRKSPACTCGDHSAVTEGAEK
jgi:FeS assembly SUF system regulator